MLLTNAEVYADNPEFQRDMLATVRASVGKITRLPSRLQAERQERDHALITPAERLRDLVDTCQMASHREVAFADRSGGAGAAIDPDAFDAVKEENRRLVAAPVRSPIERIITGNPGMLKVCRDIEKIATTNVPVLLLGESGTGKEALAKAVHDLSPRAKQPFVAINCGAIPENLLESELFGHERGAFTGAVKQTIGKIESAHKGTLFLDEIGDLPHPLQVKLLRFLQDQIVERIGGRQKIQVDVRIVSATNANLDEKTAQGVFRGDLFYRMNAFTIRIPPLRERGTDIVLLANFFLNRFNQEFNRGIRGFTEHATHAMNVHDWPGNVRELENRLKRAVVMADRRLIDAADLELAPPAEDLPDLDIRSARLRAERDVIQEALVRSNNTLSVAARLLGVSRPTLYGLMEAHALVNETNRSGDIAQAVTVTDPTTETTTQND
jgi:two-component system, NtrC family, response regulator